MLAGDIHGQITHSGLSVEDAMGSSSDSKEELTLHHQRVYPDLKFTDKESCLKWGPVLD